MRILVINPVGHSKWDVQDKKIYESFASPETSIEVISLPSGPSTVETPEALTEVTSLVVRLAKERQKGYDAIIVNCFLDPGVDLLKRILDKPVIGPCEASLAVASVMNEKTSVITVGREGLWLVEKHVRSHDYANIVVSISGIPIGVMDIDRDLDIVKELLIKDMEKLSKEKGAGIVILGCTGLAGLASEVQRATGIPTIDPAGAALKIAEAAIRLGLGKGGV